MLFLSMMALETLSQMHLLQANIMKVASYIQECYCGFAYFKISVNKKVNFLK